MKRIVCGWQRALFTPRGPASSGVAFPLPCREGLPVAEAVTSLLPRLAWRRPLWGQTLEHHRQREPSPALEKKSFYEMPQMRKRDGTRCFFAPHTVPAYHCPWCEIVAMDRIDPRYREK